MTAMKFYIDIYDPQRIRPHDFGDHLSFHLVSPTGQSSCLLTADTHVNTDLSWSILAQTVYK